MPVHWMGWEQMGGWGIGFGFLFILVALGAITLILGRHSGSSDPALGETIQSPEETLKSRYAKGEIGRDEYLRKLEDIRK